MADPRPRDPARHGVAEWSRFELLWYERDGDERTRNHDVDASYEDLVRVSTTKDRK